MEGMSDGEYQAAVSSLGLLEGEHIRLQYVCVKVRRDELGQIERHKGLLVFTNDNMIFMQQDTLPGSFFRPKLGGFSQAIRVPLENLSGVVIDGGILKINIGAGGPVQQHHFIRFEDDPITVKANIERNLSEVRAERKRTAQEALARGTVPTMVFCRYCGTKNKSDQPKCSSCGATLT